jgi:signal transduction histidine kinase
MAKAPLPVNEGARLATVNAYNHETLARDHGLQALAQAASGIADTPIALISLVERHRQWFPAKVGFDGIPETPRDEAFCSHTILGDDVFEVPDAATDPRFADNPLVTGDPGIRFYAGFPLRAEDGHKLGTLCVIDTTSRRLDDRQRAQLAHLTAAAEQFMTHHKKQADLIQVVDEARHVAECADHAKSTLLSNVTHEFHTPLNAIIGFADIIEREVYGPLPDSRYAERAHDIRVSGEVLLRIVSDVLDLARLYGGEAELRRDVVDMREVLTSVTASRRRAAEDAGVTVTPDCPERTVAAIGDELALRKSLRKVLDNAIQHTPTGSRISVELDVLSRDVAAICVTDTGPGIPPSEFDRVCREFEHLDTAHAGDDKGPGLGLAVARQLIEAQGGELSLDDNVAHGTRICLALPRASAHDESPETAV